MQALSQAEGLGFLFDDEANLAGAGSRPEWPAWLVEIFAAEPAERDEREINDPSAWLSKFRWRAERDLDHGHP